MSELQYWVWLSTRSAVRPETKRALLAHGIAGQKHAHHGQRHVAAFLVHGRDEFPALFAQAVYRINHEHGIALSASAVQHHAVLGEIPVRQPVFPLVDERMREIVGHP